MTFSREAEDRYCAKVVEEQRISVDGMPVLRFREGNTVSFINQTPQTIKIELEYLQL